MTGMSAVLEYPQRHAISVEEYLRMGEAGIFAPQARLELIEGEIIEMPPIGSPHAGTVAILDRMLGRAAGDRAVVWVQNPLRLGERSMPQPDLALLRSRADSYRHSHPAAADVLLVIEVSDTTVRFDMETKLPLYARYGIPELWIVDLNERTIRVHREPGTVGYGTSFVVRGDESVASIALADVRIAARDVF